MFSHRHPQNRMYIYRNADRGGPSHGRTNMHKHLLKFGRVFLVYASGKAGRQTDILIRILCTPPGGELITPTHPSLLMSDVIRAILTKFQPDVEDHCHC